MGKPWRRASLDDMPAPVAPVSLEYISRLPLVDREHPRPMAMDQVILLIPGFDPHRLAGDCHFDTAAAADAIDFIHECCTHVKGKLAGQALILELWIQSIIANLYGWKRPDGSRRFRDVGIWVPRKNSKTTTAAAIVLKQLFADGELGSEVYSAAAEKEQAAIIYDIAKAMIENEPELSTRAKIYTALKSIEYRETGGVYRALSADSKTKHGFNTSCYVMDELHAQKNRKLLDVLETSTGSREQPVGVIITTAAFEGPHICNEKQEYFEKVRDGVIDDAEALPVIYAAPNPQSKDFKPHAERTWRLANPNIDASFQVSYLKKRSLQARASPAFLNTFLRHHLNVRTQSNVAAINLADLDQCGRLSVSLKELRRVPCYGGLDLAQTQDLISYALWWPSLHLVIVWSWLPEDTAKIRTERENVPYLTWAADKRERLVLTPGNVADYNIVRAQVAELNSEFNVQLTAYDRYMATGIVADLLDDGLNMTGMGQGIVSMNAPTKEWIRVIAGHKVQHEHTKLIRWACGNVMLKTDAAGNVKPDKAKSKEKIDPVVAWIMAMGAASLAPPDTSAYDTRGLRRL